MNPPKVWLNPPPLTLFPERETFRSFFPELRLEIPKGSALLPANPPYFFLDLSRPLTSPLWAPHPFLAQFGPPNGGSTTSPATSPVAAPPPTGMTTDQKWDLITNIFSLIESMDAKGRRMTVNGGTNGCRYAEFSHITKEKADEAVGCVVKFKSDPHADVNLQVRKVKGRNESRITGFRVSYEKEVVKDVWPANQVAILGFRFSPPPSDKIPFYEEVSPPSFDGFQLKYIPTQNGLLDIPILGYPLYKALAEDSSELEFTHDYLDSWGLDDPTYYKASHTQDHRIPQGVTDFFNLIRHGDISPPNWINLNKKHGNPPLLDWLSFETIDISAHLREGTLSIPNFGSFNFSRNKRLKTLKEMFDKLQTLNGCESEYKELHEKYIKAWDETARIEVKGTGKKIEGVLSNLEIPWADFTAGKLKFSLRGITFDKAGIETPALLALIAKMKSGALSLNDLKIHLEGVRAEKITILDSESGAQVVITNGRIGSIDVKGPSQIDVRSLKADQLSVNEPSGFKMEVKNPDVPFLSFSREKDVLRLIGDSVKGDSLDLSYLGTTLKTGKSEIIKFDLSHSPSESKIELGELKSAGSIQYQIPDGSFVFKTSGASKLTHLKFKRTQNDAGETELTASTGLSGTIKNLSLQQNAQFSANFSDTELKEGSFQFTARLGTNPEAPLIGLRYSLDTKVTKANLDSGQMGPVAFTASKLTEGKVLIKKDDWDPRSLPQFDVSGTLDFHIAELTGKDESFNLPGLSVSGSVRDIAIAGPARFHSTGTGFILEKPEETKKPEDPAKAPPPLKVTARLEDMTVIQDPHQIKGSALSTWPGSKAVKTEMKVTRADLKIDDVGYIEFSRSDETKKRNTALQRISLTGISIDNIEAGGVAWAKFPLFYYLRGLFPKIGSVADGPDMKNSFLKLGGFKIESGDSNPIITFEGFSTELYEVGGRDQFAKIAIPFLKITPNDSTMIDTGGQLITLDISLKDKARGGSFHFKSVPRPLEERNSRLVPLDPSASK